MFTTTKAFSGFSVDDIPRAKEFYGEKLGLDVTEENGMLTLEIEGGSSIIVYPKEDHSPAVFTILNFPVDDIDRAVEGLAKRGIELERYEGFDQDEAGVFRGEERNEGPNIAWFRDPAGNILAVMQIAD